jgi:hypothetical protein
MILSRRVALVVALLMAGLGANVRAQEDEEPPVGPGRAIELGVHGGGVRFDGGGGSRLSYGGWVGLRLPNGIGLGASGTLAERTYDDEATGGVTQRADVEFYSADFSYMLKSVEPANLYGFLGAGVARFDPPEGYRALGIGRSTELVIPVGFGILWYAHGGSPWLAIRSEIRDNIVFINGNRELDTDDSIANNWQLAVGLSLLFGAYD